MLKKGDLFREYKIVEKIVSGKNVFIVSKPSTVGEKFVLKILEGGVMSDEIKIGLGLGSKCEYLVKIFDVLRGEGDDKSVYVIMEYCEEGDLSKRIGNKTPATDSEIYRFLFEGTQAICTLHEAGVIHRDVKPANFFLLKLGGYKLGDYGVARILDSIPLKTMTHVGTDGYISPEILEAEKAYTSKTDIYSFGITLLEFIMGRHPYSNDNGALNMVRAATCNPIPAALAHPHPVARLALQMIAKDPTHRPSAAAILCTALPLLAPFHTLQLQVGSLERERERENSAAQKEIDVVKKENRVLMKENARMKKENADTQSRCSALQQTLTELKAEVDALRKGKSDSISIPLSFYPNSKNGYTLTKSTSSGGTGILCQFTTDEERGIFLNEVTEANSVFQLTIQIRNSDTENSFICLGAVGSNEINTVAADGFTSSFPPPKGGGEARFAFGKEWRDGHLCSFFDGTTNEAIISPEIAVLDNSVVSVEADTGTHTLYFFVNGIRMSHAFVGVKIPFYLGFTGIRRPVVTVLSFCRLPSPSPSSLPVTLSRTFGFGG